MLKLEHKIIVTLIFSVVLVISTFVVSTSVFAKEGQDSDKNITLVKDGNSEAAIVWWSRGEADVAKFAASELRSYLKMISGADIPVIEGELNGGALESDELSSSVVVVTGEQAEEFADQTKVKIPNEWLMSSAKKLEGVKDDSFTIQTKDNHFILTGKNERGTLYASYHLLKKLGVKFLAPDFDFYEGNSEVIPDLKTVQAKAIDTLEEPDMKLRRKYMEEGWSFNPQNTNELVDWMAKHGLNILNAPYDYTGDGKMRWDDFRDDVIPELEKRGIDAEIGGHGFESFLPKEKYQEEHPDWFVKGYNVFDVANDDAVQEYVDQVVDYLKERPEIKVFDAWPPDGVNWPDTVLDKYGSASNAYAHVVNELTDAVNEELPGVRIEAIAYQSHIDPPDAEHMFNDSTIIDFAPIARSQTIPIYEGENKEFTDVIDHWKDVYAGDFAIYSYYRRYSYHSAPVVLGKLIGEDIPYYSKKNINGIGLYSEPADWMPFELSHLILADMSWDTSIDSDKYIKIYTEDRYGKASDEMGNYFDLVEDAGRTIFYKPFNSYDNLENIEKAREGYDKAKEELTEAREKVSKDTQEGFMLQRLDWNMDYTKADINYSYYKLKDDQKNMEKSEEKAKDLVSAHRFDGIILQNTYLMERYDDDVTRQNSLWVYDMYRAQDAAGMQKLVKGLKDSGEITDEELAKALDVHLAAVKQFEDTGQTEKVSEHLDGFLQLLKAQYGDEQISDKAYEVLQGTVKHVKEK